MTKFVEKAPTVRVVGVSQPDLVSMHEMVDELGVEWGRENEHLPTSIAVFAGASCYLSYDNKAKRSNAEYLRQSIVDHGHLSVIEHINVSFGVTNLPRSVQMELIRHRAGSAYSFISQRFVDTEAVFIVPPILRQEGMEGPRALFEDACESNYKFYRGLMDEIGLDYSDDEVKGTLKRKRQKEAARALLPNAIASSGVITYNARQLRHVIQMRSDQHADASIREFAEELYKASVQVIPYIFQDAVEEVIEGVTQVTFTGGK